MPNGELYVKFVDGWQVSSSSRYNYANGTYTQNNNGVWVDAFREWGVSMDSTALSQLMAPAPLKGLIENRSALEDGKRVFRQGRKLDERTLTLGMNISASTKAAFLSRYASFCNQVLAGGMLDIRTKYQSDAVYHLDYLSCQSFGEYRLELGKFVLRVVEPNPGNRTNQ